MKRSKYLFFFFFLWCLAFSILKGEKVLVQVPGTLNADFNWDRSKSLKIKVFLTWKGNFFRLKKVRFYFSDAKKSKWFFSQRNFFLLRGSGSQIELKEIYLSPNILTSKLIERFGFASWFILYLKGEVELPYERIEAVFWPEVEKNFLKVCSNFLKIPFFKKDFFSYKREYYLLSSLFPEAKNKIFEILRETLKDIFLSLAKEKSNSIRSPLFLHQLTKIENVYSLIKLLHYLPERKVQLPLKWIASHKLETFYLLLINVEDISAFIPEIIDAFSAKENNFFKLRKILEYLSKKGNFYLRFKYFPYFKVEKNKVIFLEKEGKLYFKDSLGNLYCKKSGRVIIFPKKGNYISVYDKNMKFLFFFPFLDKEHFLGLVEKLHF